MKVLSRGLVDLPGDQRDAIRDRLLLTVGSAVRRLPGSSLQGIATVRVALTVTAGGRDASAQADVSMSCP